MRSIYNYHTNYWCYSIFAETTLSEYPKFYGCNIWVLTRTSLYPERGANGWYGICPQANSKSQSQKLEGIWRAIAIKCDPQQSNLTLLNHWYHSGVPYEPFVASGLSEILLTNMNLVTGHAMELLLTPTPPVLKLVSWITRSIAWLQVCQPLASSGPHQLFYWALLINDSWFQMQNFYILLNFLSLRNYRTCK